MVVPFIVITFFTVVAVITLTFGGSDGAGYTTAVVISGVMVTFVLLGHMTYAIQPYQTGVVSTFGSYRGMLRPGFNLVSPIAMVRRVDLRTTSQDFSVDEAKTKDRTRIQVKGSYYSKIVDAWASISMVQDSRLATLALTQSEVTRVVRDMNLTEILADEGEILAARLEKAVNDGAAKWGVKVEEVKIKDVVRLQGNRFGRGPQTQEAIGFPLPSGEDSDLDSCPYCHTPMEKGAVGAESLTGGAKWHKSRSTLALGGESVGDYTSGGMVWFDGYRCRNCGKLILQA